MFITGLGTALPEKRFAQAECWEALQGWDKFHRLTSRSRALLRKVLLGDNGIARRHFAVDALSEMYALSPDVMQARFALQAPLLAAQAGERALRAAGLQPAEVDAVIVSTCTGYLCPGLTSYVSERMKLRQDVLALDLVGQGCGAALPNLRTGEALLLSGRCRQVLSICVEICSAAVYLDDDPGVLISACLFGDGAGAAVLSTESSARSRTIEWKESNSLLDPQNRDLLRFEHRDGLLRNTLTPPVPNLAASHAAAVFRNVSNVASVKRKQIANWIFHAGGRDVLHALRRQFDLSEADVDWSASVLREVGNISSPFVYHVLERALAHNAPGGLWWMSSFGAGFSCHGALLAVE